MFFFSFFFTSFSLFAVAFQKEYKNKAELNLTDIGVEYAS